MTQCCGGSRRLAPRASLHTPAPPLPPALAAPAGRALPQNSGVSLSRHVISSSHVSRGPGLCPETPTARALVSAGAGAAGRTPGAARFPAPPALPPASAHTGRHHACRQHTPAPDPDSASAGARARLWPPTEFYKGKGPYKWTITGFCLWGFFKKSLLVTFSC